MSDLIFVYGSLKQGGCYHHFMRDAQYLGDHRSTPEYTMFDLGDYPGVMAHGNTAIHGEVYRVDTATLARLDQLEEHPVVYRRVLVSTLYGDAWMYLYQNVSGDNLIICAEGNWPVSTKK